MKKIRVWIKKQLYKPIIKRIEWNANYHQERIDWWTGRMSEKTDDKIYDKICEDAIRTNDHYLTAYKELLMQIDEYILN